MALEVAAERSLPCVQSLPQPTTAAVIPHERFSHRIVTLYDVGERLRRAIVTAGFDQYGFYCAGGGFVFVTRLERINESGVPMPPPRRWDTGPQSLLVPADFLSWHRLVQALSNADAGRYRAIVFLVARRSVKIGGGDIPDPSGGLGQLPSIFSRLPFTPDYTVRALIYEFKRPYPGAVMRAVPANGTHATGSGHLILAGIHL